MKIKYKFVDGEISEIEVDDYFGDIIKEFNREQRNRNRVYRRHNYSLEAAMYQGEDYGKEDQSLLEILELFDGISDIQRKRLELMIQGYNSEEIAAIEGDKSSPRAVRKSIEIARAKIDDLLNNPKFY